MLDHILTGPVEVVFSHPDFKSGSRSREKQKALQSCFISSRGRNPRFLQTGPKRFRLFYSMESGNGDIIFHGSSYVPILSFPPKTGDGRHDFVDGEKMSGSGFCLCPNWPKLNIIENNGIAA